MTGHLCDNNLIACLKQISPLTVGSCHFVSNFTTNCPHSLLAVAILCPSLQQIAPTHCWQLPFCVRVYNKLPPLTVGSCHFVSEFTTNCPHSLLAVAILCPSLQQIAPTHCWQLPFCVRVYNKLPPLTVGSCHFVSEFTTNCPHSLLAVAILCPSLQQIAPTHCWQLPFCVRVYILLC